MIIAILIYLLIGSISSLYLVDRVIDEGYEFPQVDNIEIKVRATVMLAWPVLFKAIVKEIISGLRG